MFKQFSFAILTLALAVVMTSCQSGSTPAQDEAREAVTTAPAPTNAQPAPTVAVPQGPTTAMEFSESTFDFGTVTEGEVVSHTFSFTNTGSEPLIISDAKGSCGCTVPSKPTAPIAPGEAGEITVNFNSKNKSGARNQKVTVTANTNPAQTFIYLTGNVEKDPAAATQK
ncbi:hypothetical protein CEQ90_00880 [Lewinellaceae bacterium SD302]|nr:hypothetical protein CEQ90_00880 [Lewinellaceae bacterium SD302]